MKAHVYDNAGTRVKEITLPSVFATAKKPLVIKRAVLAMQANKRQPYGSDPLAGKRTSAHYHARRRYRFAMMNKEMSRIPRIHGKGAGHYAYVARFAPHAVKGRKAHPPKAEKIWALKVNVKERQLAVKSALAYAADLAAVQQHGYKTTSAPIIFLNEFETLAKTKDVMELLEKIIPAELERCAKKKVRAGKGTMRGRKYNKKVGPLIITGAVCNVQKAAKNIPGVDAVSYDELNAELLAPGAQPGRLIIVTESALQKLAEKFGE
ncbi:MAG: 50S ribosomal protein L4 [Candidatus Aenigmarchaeota archaeon]|nr:50S ribosomal protein L4 [Candidatus Aenigmarchaeota archaeon]